MARLLIASSNGIVVEVLACAPGTNGPSIFLGMGDRMECFETKLAEGPVGEIGCRRDPRRMGRPTGGRRAWELFDNTLNGSVKAGIQEEVAWFIDGILCYRRRVEFVHIRILLCPRVKSGASKGSPVLQNIIYRKEG